MGRAFWVLATIFAGFIVLSVGFKPVSAQSADVAPYLIGRAGDTRIFKTVYQGCELFVVVGTPGANWQTDAAIATGRGCK